MFVVSRRSDPDVFRKGNEGVLELRVVQVSSYLQEGGIKPISSMFGNQF